MENRREIEEIVKELKNSPPRILSKYFYDERGSQLFEQICFLDEYYLTRSELQIMNNYSHQIAYCIGEKTFLVELGSGSGIKTEILLRNLQNPCGYVPVDLSTKILMETAEKLKKEFPFLQVCPLNADFTKEFKVPEIKEADTITYYFPGSTIGNFKPAEASALVNRLRNGAPAEYINLVIGIDIIKDKDILNAAYNDKKGVTAEFNKNILLHINRLTNGNFNPEQFRHIAFFNEEESRIEMHLESKVDQEVKLNSSCIFFPKGERILTEYSYKYNETLFNKVIENSFIKLAEWRDPNELFSVLFCKARK